MVRIRGDRAIATWTDRGGTRRQRSIAAATVGSIDAAVELAKGIEDKHRRARVLNVLEEAGMVETGSGQPVVSATFPVLLARHLDEMRRRKLTKGHQKARRLICEKVTAGLTRVDELDTEHVRRYLHAGEDTGWSPRTFNHHREHITSFCKWMVRNGFAPSNPVEAIPSRRDFGGVLDARTMTRDEALRLFSAAPFFRGEFYRFVLMSGLRWSEAVGLRAGDYNPAQRVLTIPARVSKNRRESVIPMHPDLLRSMCPGVRPADPLWPRHPARETWKADLAAAGIPYRTDHGGLFRKSTRKTFATWLLDAGVEPGTVDLLMRHESSIRQRHYTDRTALIENMRTGLQKLQAWLLEPRLIS